MRRFLLDLLLFAAIMGAVIGGYVWSKWDYFPAPNITTNSSLNTKLHMLKERRGQRISVLALGSSMTLNNLSSRAVIDALHDTSYLNLGAWGTNMEQSVALAHDILPIVKPSTLVVVTNLGDFSFSAERYAVNPVRLERYLTRWSELWAYVKTRDMGYYLRDMELNEVRMNDPGNYERLVFDRNGGVELNVPKDRIDPERFNKKPPPLSDLAESQYKAFGALCALTKKEGVHLIVIQAPYRQGIRNEEVDSIVQLHVQRLQGIMKPFGHEFLNGTTRNWPDSLYCDHGHFNGSGAYEFTMYAFAQR
jgi:hypothetical protein